MTALHVSKHDWQSKAFPIMTAIGWILITLSFVIGLAILTPTAVSYWGGNAKATRDAAEAGSTLIGQLQTLAVTSRWLEPLTFVGVAAFMLGIALLFSLIPSFLKARGDATKAAFPSLVKLGGKPAGKPMPASAAPFPFGMIERMMPMYPMIAVMGVLIVLIAFLIGLLVLSPAQATFLSDAKSVREVAAAGSTFVDANVTRHAIEAWVLQFKFFGLGLGLMAITMALGTIASRLREMGYAISSHMPEQMRQPMPAIPARVRIFQILALMGIMVLLVALIIGIILAVGVVPSYWNHSIANELNPAQPGSQLLSELGIVSSYAWWLNPLHMVGMALLFTAITIALTVIVGTLRQQTRILIQFDQRVHG